MTSSLRTLVAGALLAASAHAQSLWIVDGANAPDADFTDLPPAVAVAAPGDVILMRYASGVFYSGVTIDKALSIVSDPEPTTGNVIIPSITGPLLVENVSTGSVRLTLFGLNGSDPNEAALVIRNCSAPVWIDGVSIENGNASDPDDSFPRYVVEIEDSAQVVFTRGQITGYGGFVFNERGPRGLFAKDSTLYLQHASIRGAKGEPAYFLGGSFGVIQARDGEDAAHVDGGRVFLSNSEVRGHRGGAGLFQGGVCHPAGDGGDGLVMTGGAELVRFDSAVGGGQAGVPGNGCPPAVAGTGLVTSGSVQNLPGDAPWLITERLPWREGLEVHYEFRGQAGDLVLLLWGPAVLPVEWLAFSGVLVPQALSPLVLGIADGSGALPLDVTVPALPTSLNVATLVLQGLHASPGGAIALGPAAAATWVP